MIIIWFELLQVISGIGTSQCTILSRRFEIFYACYNNFIFQIGRTPLTAACEGGHSATAQLLIENGADLFTRVRPHVFCCCLSYVHRVCME